MPTPQFRVVGVRQAEGGLVGSGMGVEDDVVCRELGISFYDHTYMAIVGGTRRCDWAL